MTKTSILNVLSKTFLVLAMVNSCALSSASAAKKKAAEQKVEKAGPISVAEAIAGDMAKVVSPSLTEATVLVSTLPPNPNTVIPSYLNPNADNGKLVSGGTLLSNNICPWKIGQVPDQKTGAYKPLQKGTKVTNADNYFQDPKGTTNFCGSVNIAGDLTVTGTLSSSTGQFCLTSNVAVGPNNTLLVNNINPVKTVGGACVADDSTCAFTEFSGDIDIHGRRLGSFINVTLNSRFLRIFGFQFASNIYDCPTSTPIAVKIHFVGYGSDIYDDCFSVAFTEEVAISPDLYTGDTSLCLLSAPVNCRSGCLGADILLTAQRVGGTYDQNPDIFLQLHVDGDFTYVGDIFYEIIYSNNLTSITCLPPSEV